MATTNPANKSALAVLLGALALIGGVLAALYFSGGNGGNTSISSGTLLQQPRALPTFALTDEKGQAFTPASLLNHWTLMFPGFTYCPDVCPTTLGLLKTVQARLGDQGARLQVVLFSIDPQRDTPEVLQRYVSFFSPDFKGVTTPEPGLQQLAAALGVAYIKVPGDVEGNYTMDHSSALILINPQGQLAGYFTPPFQVDALVKDLESLLQTP
ncbi:MAG: SCO family protein [Pseudomonadota bacterium]|nr:SCO family protein [Pseudomonadota bacterium]